MSYVMKTSVRVKNVYIKLVIDETVITHTLHYLIPTLLKQPNQSK